MMCTLVIVFCGVRCSGDDAFTAAATIYPCKCCDYIVDGLTDGRKLHVQPGAVICLDAHKDYSNHLLFRYILGSETAPVIIRNCDGVASVHSPNSYGIKFERSKFFRLLGDGTGPGTYGIHIGTVQGFFLTMELFTSNFEIAQVEIAGPSKNGQGSYAGFAGIGVKTSPYQDCKLFEDPTRTAWVMRNVSIHDNYIHDTGGEGMYIGHGFYTGRKEATCPKVTYSHSIKGLRVYDNYIENVGNDGIQIKNADEDVQVYHNVVIGYGTRSTPAQDEGLFIGEGSTGTYFGNVIDTGTGNGCQIQGIGNIDLYHNYFINSGENGIYVSGSPYAIRWPDGYFNISGNLIYNSSDDGFVFYNKDGGSKLFSNNVVALAKRLVEPAVPVSMRDNLLSNDPDDDISTQAKMTIRTIRSLELHRP